MFRAMTPINPNSVFSVYIYFMDLVPIWSTIMNQLALKSRPCTGKLTIVGLDTFCVVTCVGLMFVRGYV